MTAVNVFTIPVRVYIEDTDAGGIVYYVNYLKYMERCRTEFLRSLGYHKPAILDGGLLFVVHTANIKYHRPARLDDQLSASCKIEKLARSYIEFQQQVMRGDELLCEGLIRIACVSASTMKPSAIPAEMHRQIDQFFYTQSTRVN